MRQPNMPTLQEEPRPHAEERRSLGRTKINRGVLMHFAGCEGVHACCVHDVTNLGAGIRFNGLKIVPFGFGISFDSRPLRSLNER
jgi:hypothetical protein